MAIKPLLLVLALFSFPLQSATLPMPPSDSDLIGQNKIMLSKYEDTLLDIARNFGIGQKEILIANPLVDRWLPGEATRVFIPSQHILPEGKRKGIVINLPEMRLYYFDQKNNTIWTHPVSVGRMDWNSPLGITKIIEKKKNPTWTPPASIKKEHLEKGDPLPNVVPAGPENPLGERALRLGVPGYLIHGTNNPWGVGQRVTHGCIRMYPEDIERLFDQVHLRTRVELVNQPLKASLSGGMLFVESHPSMEEENRNNASLLRTAIKVIKRRTGLSEGDYSLQALRETIEESTGAPVYIPKPGEPFVQVDLPIVEQPPRARPLRNAKPDRIAIKELLSAEGIFVTDQELDVMIERGSVFDNTPDSAAPTPLNNTQELLEPTAIRTPKLKPLNPQSLEAGIPLSEAFSQ